MARGWTPPAGFAAARRTSKAAQLRADTTGSRSARLTNSSDSRLTWESTFQLLHGFIDENMLVIADTSFVLFPAAEFLIRKRKYFIAQAAWLSIGYSAAATVGASMTLPKGPARVVALAGDGGFQMTAAALSTLARYRKPAIVLLFDNGIYGIEQLLTNKAFYPEESQEPLDFFNELARWDYVKYAEALGCQGYLARTQVELSATLAAVQASVERPCLIDIKLPARDLPPEIRASLQPTASIAQTTNGLTTAEEPDSRPRIALAGLN